MKNKIPKITLVYIFIIAGIFSFIAAVILIKIEGTPYLFAYDPWMHYYFTKLGEARELFSNSIPVHNGNIFLAYRSIMRTSIYLFSLLSGVDLFTLYRYSPIFLRIVFIILAYMCIHTYIEDRRVLLLSLMMIFTSKYFFIRSFITFPENFALVAHLAVFYSLRKFQLQKDNRYLVIFILSLVGVVFIHPKSLYISGFIIDSFLIYFLVQKQFRYILDIVKSSFAAAIVSFPAMIDTLHIFWDTIITNVGSTSATAYDSLGDIRYLPPSLTDYEFFIGILMFIFTILGLVYIIKNHFHEYLPLILFFLQVFVLSLGTWINIYVPTDRMQAYLFLPIIPISTIYLEYLFRKSSSPYFRLGLTAIIFGFMVSNILGTNPWFALEYGEFGMSEKINSLIKDNPSLLIHIDDESQSVIPLIEDPSRICKDINLDSKQTDIDSKLIEECNNADYYLTRFPVPPKNNYSYFTKDKTFYLYKLDELN